jgi:ABC-type amino acid transport substrate-binding protein
LTSLPVFYQPVFFATKISENRFDNDISKINDKNIRVSVLEGDVPETILNELYQDSQRVTLPQSASFPQVFQEVASGKADVTITAKPDMYEFEASNPNVLKIITNQPVRLYPSGLQFPIQAQSPDDYYFIQNPYSKMGQ